MNRVCSYFALLVSTVQIHGSDKNAFDLLEISLTKSQSAVVDTPITDEEFTAMIRDFKAGEKLLRRFFRIYDIGSDDSVAMRNEHWEELAEITKKQMLSPEELAQKRETALSLADLLLRKVNIVLHKVIKQNAKKKPIGINLSALLSNNKRVTP